MEADSFPFCGATRGGCITYWNSDKPNTLFFSSAHLALMTNALLLTYYGDLTMKPDQTSHWSMASTFIALLVLFASIPGIASAQTCTVDCLRVFSIELADLGDSIRGTVKLTNETGAGAGARGSVVHAVWTRPDGSTLDQYANIGTRLRAEFRLYTAGTPGTYTLTVVNATKPGYMFDPDNSTILSQTITIGNTANQPPVAFANADFTSGSVPLTVTFSSSGSYDPDGMIVAYAWDFGDGNTSTDMNPVHTYTGVGNFTAKLAVTDNMGATSVGSTTIIVMDSNAGCTSNCLSVDDVSLRYSAKSKRIRGLVSLVDENNSAIKGALVHAQLTLPDGSTVDQYSTTRKNSTAEFTLKATAPGLYTLRVVEVSKTGYTFDPDSSNVLESSINVVQ
jgi:PKD repeat protein